MKKTCADFGGMTRAGKPCGRQVTDGRCLFHSDEAEQELAKAKATYLEEYARTLISSKAAAVAGMSVMKVWRLCQTDPEFAAAVDTLKEETETARYAAVEQAGIDRILDHSAPAAIHIFYLVNMSRRRGDGRWKHIQNVRQSNVNVDMDHASEEELNRISAGEDPLDVFIDTRTRGLSE